MMEKTKESPTPDISKLSIIIEGISQHGFYQVWGRGKNHEIYKNGGEKNE
jgi:hypothetical protein